MKWTPSAFEQDVVELTLEDIANLLTGHRLTDSGCDVLLAPRGEPARSTWFGEPVERPLSHIEEIKRRAAVGIRSMRIGGREPLAIHMRRVDRETIKRQLPGEYRRGDLLLVLGIPVMLDERVPPGIAEFRDQDDKAVYWMLLD